MSLQRDTSYIVVVARLEWRRSYAVAAVEVLTETCLQLL